MPRGVYYRSPELKEILKARILTVPKLKHQSEEAKEKIRLSKIGKKRTFTEEWIENLRQASMRAGCKPPKNDLRGYKHSLETRINNSKAQRGKWSGNKNPKWRGGVSSESTRIRSSSEYWIWRTRIFQRDKYQCIIGGKKHGNKLQADHIKPFALFPELRFDLDNGRTLCIDCHKKTDSYGANFFKNYLGSNPHRYADFVAQYLNIPVETQIATLI